MNISQTHIYKLSAIFVIGIFILSHSQSIAQSVENRTINSFGGLLENEDISLVVSGAEVLSIFNNSGEISLQSASVIYNNSPENQVAAIIEDIPSEFNISPNPFDQFIYINQKEGLFGAFVIYNLSGKVVMRGVINSTNMQLNTSEFNQGLYLLKLIGKNNISVKKLTK